MSFPVRDRITSAVHDSVNVNDIAQVGEVRTWQRPKWDARPSPNGGLQARSRARALPEPGSRHGLQTITDQTPSNYLSNRTRHESQTWSLFVTDG